MKDLKDETYLCWKGLIWPKKMVVVQYERDLSIEKWGWSSSKMDKIYGLKSNPSEIIKLAYRYYFCLMQQWGLDSETVNLRGEQTWSTTGVWGSLLSDKPETVVDHGLVASIMIVYNPKLVFKLCFVRTILLVFLLMEVRSRVLDHTFGGGCDGVRGEIKTTSQNQCRPMHI